MSGFDWDDMKGGGDMATLIRRVLRDPAGRRELRPSEETIAEAMAEVDFRKGEAGYKPTTDERDREWEEAVAVSAAFIFIAPWAVRAKVAEARVRELEALINTPEVDDFDKALPLEAVHQVQRWGTKHDEGKEPEDWFWVLSHLASRALSHWKEYLRLKAIQDDGCEVSATGLAYHREKALHHCVTSAAVMRNWHAHVRQGTAMLAREIAA
jgi:hypothetical protein